MGKYEQETIDMVNENYRRQKEASALERVFEYAYYEEQPKKIVEKHQAGPELKEKVAAVILAVSLAAGAIAWNVAVDKRTEKLMDTYTDYLKVTEMTGQEVNQETYQQFIDNNGYQDYQDSDEQTRGGR